MNNDRSRLKGTDARTAGFEEWLFQTGAIASAPPSDDTHLIVDRSAAACIGPRGTLTDSRERKARCCDLVKRMPAIVCQLAPNGNTLFVSDNITRIAGYLPEELQGRNWWEVFYPGDQSRQVEEVCSRFQRGDILDHEMTLTAKDGSLRTLSWTSANGYSQDGTLEDILLTGIGITERKQAEELFRTLSNSSPIGIYIVQDGKFQFANPQFQEWTGRRKEELLGVDSTELVAPDFRDSVRNNAASMLKGERSNPYEFQIYSKSGQTRWIMETVAPIQYQGRRAVLGNFMDITNWKQAEENLKQSLEKLRKTLEGTIQAMALTVEMRDPYTAGHQRRVANLACAIAREMQLPKEQVDTTYLATIVHDIGKICVPAEILSKPGRISDIEFGLIKAHSQVGYDILKTIEFPWPIAEIVLQHHERMDGSGYPSGMMGREPHLEARILGVADVVEAMASHRPYRPSLGIERALQEISHNSGILYDPEVVDACLRLFGEKGFRLE